CLTLFLPVCLSICPYVFEICHLAGWVILFPYVGEAWCKVPFPCRRIETPIASVENALRVTYIDRISANDRPPGYDVLTHCGLRLFESGAWKPKLYIAPERMAEAKPAYITIPLDRGKQQKKNHYGKDFQ